MRVRYFRTADGWCADMFVVDGDEFTVSIEAHEADLSAYYGAPVTASEQDAEDPDPRTLPYVSEPDIAPPDVQPTPFQQLVEALATEPALSQQTKDAINVIAGGAELALGQLPLVPRT